MSAHRDLSHREWNLRRLLALAGKGNQQPITLDFTPRELETIAIALDFAAADYETFAADDLEPDEVLADVGHVADLYMLRDRLRTAYEDKVA